MKTCVCLRRRNCCQIWNKFSPKRKYVTAGGYLSYNKGGGVEITLWSFHKSIEKVHAVYNGIATWYKRNRKNNNKKNSQQ